MKILIINVSLRPNSPVKFFPIGLGYIATAIKNAGYDFDLLDIDAHRYTDDYIEQFIRTTSFDVICMGCIVTGYKIIKTLSSLIRTYQPHAKIIVGNSVATSIPEILLTRTEADIAVMGEGDETIVDILNTLAEGGNLEAVPGICFLHNGQVVHTPARAYIRDISSLPFINYSLFDAEIYAEAYKNVANEDVPIPRDEIRSLPINTARGCIARCTFCYHVFKTVPYRKRSADAIVKEIKSLVETYGVNYIQFADELTFNTKKQALELSEKMLQENVNVYWSGDCRGDLFQEEDDVVIIKKLKEAGCVSMGYSLESSEPAILKAMNKKIIVEQFSKQTRLFRQAGLATITSLVIGYPQETPETIRKTLECCIENRIYPSTGYLLPQPGSRMYDYAIEQGFITDQEEYLLKMGDRQDLRLNMTNMSDDELEACVDEGLKRCNEALNVGLTTDQLLKTQFYRKAKESEI